MTGSRGRHDFPLNRPTIRSFSGRPRLRLSRWDNREANDLSSAMAATERGHGSRNWPAAVRRSAWLGSHHRLTNADGLDRLPPVGSTLWLGHLVILSHNPNNQDAGDNGDTGKHMQSGFPPCLTLANTPASLDHQSCRLPAEWMGLRPATGVRLLATSSAHECSSISAASEPVLLLPTREPWRPKGYLLNHRLRNEERAGTPPNSRRIRKLRVEFRRVPNHPRCTTGRCTQPTPRPKTPDQRR